jgi:5-formyltetrahydrofolate cyclo-ligase
MKAKTDMRKTMKDALASQSEEERKQKSRFITASLCNLPEYKGAKTILSYVSMAEEVSTLEFIKSSLSIGKTVIVPVVDNKTEILTFHEIRSEDELAPGYKGIPEPKSCKCVFPHQKIDLAILPGLAFDEKGGRLGRGKGMFDKCIGELACPKIALSFDFQMVASVPAVSHDLPVDIVITEKRVIRASR